MDTKKQEETKNDTISEDIFDISFDTSTVLRMMTYKDVPDCLKSKTDKTDTKNKKKA